MPAPEEGEGRRRRVVGRKRASGKIREKLKILVKFVVHCVTVTQS